MASSPNPAHRLIAVLATVAVGIALLQMPYGGYMWVRESLGTSEGALNEEIHKWGEADRKAARARMEAAEGKQAEAGPL